MITSNSSANDFQQIIQDLDDRHGRSNLRNTKLEAALGAVTQSSKEDLESDVGQFQLPRPGSANLFPSQGFKGDDLSPHILISALASRARKEILISCRELNPDTYCREQLIQVFSYAAAHGIKIWILLRNLTGRDWIESHSFTKELTNYEDTTVFIRLILEDDAFRDWRNIDYIVVDGEYIRYEKDFDGPHAIAVKSESGGDDLRTNFRDRWNASRSLNGFPPGHIEVKLKRQDNGIVFYQCELHPGIVTYVHDNDYIGTLKKLLPPLNASMNYYYDAEGISYDILDTDVTAETVSVTLILTTNGDIRPSSAFPAELSQ